MKTVLYLIQAAGGLPEIYECLKTRSYLLLSYKEETSDTTIYAPNTTWAGGRNRLYQYVKDNHLLYDYYVFMDEDIVFKQTNSILIPDLNIFQYRLIAAVCSNDSARSWSSRWPLKSLFSRYDYQLEEQEAGFANFEESLKLDYPVMTMSLYHYNAVKYGEDEPFDGLPEEIWRKGTENLNWSFQTIDWVDGILNALSQEVFFANTVLPYTEKYDADCWWMANAIFLIKANHYYPNQCIQNNQYTMLNIQSHDYPRGSRELFIKILTQAYAEICAEVGVDKIQLSEGKEIKPSAPLKQVEGRFMSRFGFFVKVISPATIFLCINDRSRAVCYIKIYTKGLFRLILPGMLFTRMMKIRQSFKKMRHRQ